MIQASSAIPPLESATSALPLTCSIESNQLTCLLGQRFSLLNTYMEMLAGIYPPDKGDIIFADRLISSNCRSTIPTLAYLYHDCALVSVLNGIDNVRVPALYHHFDSQKNINKAVRELLAEFDYGANHRLLPAFMDALQKRHLLIARAVLLKPHILFIENPFKDLDREQVRLLGNYIASLTKNKNMAVIVSHVNLDFVQNYADQIIYFSPKQIQLYDRWNSFSDALNARSY